MYARCAGEYLVRKSIRLVCEISQLRFDQVAFRRLKSGGIQVLQAQCQLQTLEMSVRHMTIGYVLHKAIVTYRCENISVLLRPLVKGGRAVEVELDGAQISVENVELGVRREHRRIYWRKHNGLPRNNG